MENADQAAIKTDPVLHLPCVGFKDNEAYTILKSQELTIKSNLSEANKVLVGCRVREGTCVLEQHLFFCCWLKPLCLASVTQIDCDKKFAISVKSHLFWWVPS